MQASNARAILRRLHPWIGKAVHDEEHTPGVISISWGSPEDGLAETDKKAFSDAFAETDEMNRQCEFLRQRYQDAAARCAVELREDEAGDLMRTLERELQQQLIDRLG
jgi:hypothetical protein